MMPITTSNSTKVKAHRLRIGAPFGEGDLKQRGGLSPKSSTGQYKSENYR
jgi:hypothetical protein